MAKKINTKMNKIRLYYDSQGNTLNVWFDDPKKEHISEEVGEGVILNKNKNGNVIGFEKLNYLSIGQILKDLSVVTAVS